MENVNIKIPIPYIAAKWLWNLICLIAIGTCIYIYIYMQHLYSNLTKEKKEHSIHKDSVTSRIDVLITVIKHKNSTILKSEEKLKQLNQKVNLAYTKLAKNKEVLDNIYKLRDSLSNNKTEFTDEQRKIWLNNEFYLSPNASDSNK